MIFSQDLIMGTLRDSFIANSPGKALPLTIYLNSHLSVVKSAIP